MEGAGRNTGQRLGPNERQSTADGKLILLVRVVFTHTHTHTHTVRNTQYYTVREESLRTVNVGQISHSLALSLFPSLPSTALTLT